MAVISVEDGILVTYVLGLDGKQATTKVWVKKTNSGGFGPPDVGFLRSIANEAADHFKNTLYQYCSNQATFLDCHATDVDPLDGSGLQVHAETAHVGSQSGSGQASPLAASLLVTLHAGARGRSHQNRMFVPYIGETVVDRGRLTPGDLITANAGANQFKSDMESTIDGWRIAILRRKSAPAGRTGVLEDCEDIVVSERIAYQLRRSR